MSRHKIWIVATSILALLVAAPMLASARPAVGGHWKGQETQWYDGANWQPFSHRDRTNLVVRFTVRNGKVVNFRARTRYYTCTTTGRRYVVTPLVRHTRLYRRHGKRWFFGKSVRTVGGRRYVAEVLGTFSSSHEAMGGLESRLSGCRDYSLTFWEVTKKAAHHRHRGGGGGGGGGGYSDGGDDTFNPCVPYPYGGCWIR